MGWYLSGEAEAIIGKITNETTPVRTGRDGAEGGLPPPSSTPLPDSWVLFPSCSPFEMSAKNSMADEFASPDLTPFTMSSTWPSEWLVSRSRSRRRCLPPLSRLRPGRNRHLFRLGRGRRSTHLVRLVSGMNSDRSLRWTCSIPPGRGGYSPSLKKTPEHRNGRKGEKAVRKLPDQCGKLALFQRRSQITTR